MSDLSGRVIHDENNRGSADGLIGVLRSTLSDFHGQPNGLSPFKIIKNNQSLSQGLIRAGREHRKSIQRRNPYHNSINAADVMHSAFYFINQKISFDSGRFAGRRFK